MRTDHVIPVSKQALDILKQYRAMSDGSDLIVPGDKPGKPISENRMLFLVYRLGMLTKATVHGFRSTFSIISNESEQCSADAIEKALAHSSKNAVRAPYYRGMRLEERRGLMQWWSDKPDEFEAAGVKKSSTDLSDRLGG